MSSFACQWQFELLKYSILSLGCVAFSWSTISLSGTALLEKKIYPFISQELTSANHSTVRVELCAQCPSPCGIWFCTGYIVTRLFGKNVCSILYLKSNFVIASCFFLRYKVNVYYILVTLLIVCVTKYLTKSNLREEGLICSHSAEGKSPSQQARCGSRTVMQRDHIAYSHKAERDNADACLLLHIHSWTPAHVQGESSHLTFPNLENAS